MHWCREARFGMFIHWGLYAIPAGVKQKGLVVRRAGETGINVAVAAKGIDPFNTVVVLEIKGARDVVCAKM